MQNSKFKTTTQNSKLFKVCRFAAFSLLFALSSLPFALPRSAEAHILKTDGNIGAVLHTDPQDDPIVGEQSNFFFEFKDKTGKFDATNCQCTVSILENAKKLVTDPMVTDPSNTTYGSYSFTFPQKDVYEVVVTGKPLTEGAFQPFTLSYDIRVAREETTEKAQPGFIATHIPHAIGAVVIAILFICLLIFQKKNEKKKA